MLAYQASPCLKCSNPLLAVIVLFAGLCCIAVCIVTLLRISRLDSQCRQHVFAKQLQQLVIVDLGAAIALLILLIFYLNGIYSDFFIGYFVVVFLCLLFVAVSVFTETLIVVGFTSTVAKHRGCVRAIVNYSWVIAWLTGLTVSAFATGHLFKAKSNVLDDFRFAVYVASLISTNFVVAGGALVLISVRLQQHIMIRWPLFKRIRRNYLITFILKNLVFIGNALLNRYVIVGIYDGLLLDLISLCSRGIMDALCYSCNFHSCYRSINHYNILESLLYFLEDASSDVENQADRQENLTRSRTSQIVVDSYASDATQLIPAIITPSVTSQRQQCQTCLSQLRRRVDAMWTQELRINHTAEMLNVVLDAADAAEAGEDMDSIMTHAKDKLHQVGAWVQECICIRADARSAKCSLLGGVETLQQREASYHDDYLKSTIEPMLCQLSEIAQIPEVKAETADIMRKLEADLKSVGHHKEATSDQLIDCAHHLPELQEEESAFAEAALRAARANPESARLQHTALQAMVMRMHVTREIDSICSEIEIAEIAEDWFDYIVFAMGRHPLDADIQREGANAMGLCVTFLTDVRIECAQHLLQAAKTHESNMGVAVQCRAALLGIARKLPEDAIQHLQIGSALEKTM